MKLQKNYSNLPYKLINGECIEEMTKIEENSVDMVFCDLPYGTTRNSWDSVIDLNLLWQQYNRIVKDTGAIVLTAANPFDKILAMSNFENFRYDWIWEKNKATGHLNCKKVPLKSHEYVLVFYKKNPVYNPQFTFGHKPMNAVKPKKNIPSPEKTRNYAHLDEHFGNPGGETKRYPRSVIKIPVINNDDKLKWHPTQKPVQLPEYFIKTYSNEGDVILDNCMGSGSTGIACINLKRKFIGIEMDTDYYKNAKNWIESNYNNTILKFT
jgi:site-specific DNA-methyltransferase (adenine-specific)